MLSFETIDEQQLSEMLRNRKELRFLISESVVKFGTTIPSVDFSSPQEIPPTPVIFTPDLLAQVIVHAGADLDGKYTRFVVTVYACGGKIFYTSIGSGKYEAHVEWPSA
ncbi:MAG: hypothetical protein CEE38_09120 [Planctomycetes bacterium B3_Pla]|nr:MAG: hypothetical protein CEE38_09120 [Planctomycetes bacterium B3_Pla]